MAPIHKSKEKILPLSPSPEQLTEHSDSERDRDRASGSGSSGERDSSDSGSEQNSNGGDNGGDNTDDNDEGTRAYQLIWDAFCGLPLRDAYPSFFLTDQAYEKLNRRISKHDGLALYTESLRKDWNAETGTLTLRLMPSLMHEHVQDCLVDAIKKELDRIARDYILLRPFRNRIKSCAHADCKTSHVLKSPDGQFIYIGTGIGTAYPQLVIEVAYSEGERNAMNKAHEYFTEMLGKVGAVLLVDIHHAPKLERRSNYSHSASLSLWTSRKEDGVLSVQRVVNVAVFRNDDGQAAAGELVLPFELFVPPDQRSNLPPNVALRLSYNILSEFVSGAEQLQRLADTTPPPPSPVNKIKFLDEHGAVVSETVPVPSGVKRRRLSPPNLSPRRTRSASRLRRSPRLHSSNKDV